MKESLRIRKLGPLKDAKIEPRPLTVIIGPQASGKSLIAQCLYFFRGLEAHLAKRFKHEWSQQAKWEKTQLKRLLDDLRKVAFGYFANGTASVSYENGVNGHWEIKAYETNRLIYANDRLVSAIAEWSQRWQDSVKSWSQSRGLNHIFIPTERSMFTRYADRYPDLVFNPEIQPFPFWEFSNFLSRAKMRYPAIYDNWLMQKKKSLMHKHFEFILDCQLRALAGAAYLPTHGPRLWKWSIASKSSSSVTTSYEKKIIPIEACASGQTEAWPFFVIASTYGAYSYRIIRKKPPLAFSINESHFYFEEPETHLHPAAQIEVMKAIAYLVYLKHPLLITTHSPFILYIINNMIMRYLASGENFKDGKVALNPDDVAVYRIVDGKCQEILDREDTKLIPETELDDVATQLGVEFDELLDKVHSLDKYKVHHD